MKRKGLMVLCSVLVVAWLSGCATMETSKEKPYRMTPQGMVIWEDEFEFLPPPPDWKLLRVEAGENDINFGFMRTDPGSFPSLTTFAYDEEPFGCTAASFDGREREFFQRFLFNAILQFQILERKKVQVVGGEGLAVLVEGKDPVKKEKVRAKVVFGKRGGRIVGFYITQWRPMDASYDPSAFEIFDKFVASFKFLKKSFYENL
ncbi:MAG TPA: hypothetical protein VMV04_02730 [Thermodesulfobacteriota bacterium]|jgi:hypothetical protein|nr:hypothetical protein [Thermodesulfobacteriota bacterium]